MANASTTPAGAAPTSVAAGGSSRHHQAPYHPQYHTQAPHQPKQQKRPFQQAAMPTTTSAVPAKKTFNFTLKDIDRYIKGFFFNV